MQLAYGLAALCLAAPLCFLLQQASGAFGAGGGLGQRAMLSLLGNSLMIVGLVTTFAVALGFALAFLVVKTDLPGKQFWQVAFVLPLSIPSYIGAIVYSSLLAPRGVVERWLGQDLWNIYGADGVVFVLTLFTFPYSFLICRSQLQRMGGIWEQSAFDLGVSRARAVWEVVIPLCRGALASSALLIGLYVLADFGAIALLRFNTFTTAIFYQLDSFNRENASVLGLALLLLAMVPIFLRDRILQRKGDGPSLGDSLEQGQHSFYPLGRGKWPVLCLLVGVVLCSLVVPLLTLIYHLWEGGAQVDWHGLWRPLGYGLLVAAATATGVAIAATVAGYGLQVWDGPGLQWFKKVALSLYALPGILLALGTISLSSAFFGEWYGTILPLLLGLFIHFFPLGREAMDWGQKSLGQHLLDASFDLGHGHFVTSKRVFLPLIKGAVAAAFLLVFVSTLKELPLQLLLRPPGMTTLSVQLWIDAGEAFYSQASLYGLAIIALAATATPVILRKY